MNTSQLHFWQPNDGIDNEPLTSSDLVKRLKAERAYNVEVMSHHAAIFERAARGLPLLAWERRIVRNRTERLREAA